MSHELLSKEKANSPPLKEKRESSHDGFDLPFKESNPLFQNCSSGITLTNGERFTTVGLTPEISTCDNKTSYIFPGDSERPEMQWVSEIRAEGTEIQVSIRNTTNINLELDTIDVLDSPSGFLKRPLDQLAISQMSWQAQSPLSVPTDISMHERVQTSLRSPECQVGIQAQPGEALSPWMVRIHDRQSDKKVIAGFTTAFHFSGYFSFTPTFDGHSMRATNYLEGRTLPPHESLQSEKLLMCSGEDEQDALSQYADVIAREMKATPWKKPLTGATLWYQRYGNINEDIEIANLTKISEINDRLGIEYYQIDDGYQKELGDPETNDNFPHGLGYIAEQIKARGMKPGIWLAPFMVSERSNTFQDHPEWMVHDENGDPTITKYHGGWKRNIYTLDVTHPEAGEKLRQDIRTLKEQKFEYLKLDFIYAGAVQGQRFDPNSTSIEAYRKGMEIINEEAKDMVILGCQGPFIPSVGLVHAMRTGHDTTREWEKQINEDVLVSLRNPIRAAQDLWWMNEKLWQNDPDCIIVRENHSDLTLPEIQSWATIAALSNGVLMGSDDFTGLEPERLALLEKVFELRRNSISTTIPLDHYTSEGLSERMLSIVVDGEEKKVIAALCNWSDEERKASFIASEWGLPEDGNYTLLDFWADKTYTVENGEVDLPPLPPHGTYMLIVSNSEAM